MKRERMNQIEELSRKLKRHAAGAVVELDPPAQVDGSWWMDVERLGRRVSVEWRPSVGFGVSTPSDAYGEGPDEFYDDVDTALSRIVDLLESGGRTEPIEPSALRRLREARNVTQVELAELMGVRQATVSKMERRGDVNLDTLRRFIRALGGVLEIRARFPDRTLPIEPDPERAK